MSVTKLMGRIVHPTEILATEDHTFAATFQDPLIQFSCVLSGLVHDADHSGLSNAILVQEGDPLAHKYHAKSVAEQNSLDLCWKLLMQPQYQALQAAIFDHQQDELERFRSILVQCVMATDIQDKDLGAKRKERWAKAFAENNTAKKRGCGGDSDHDLLGVPHDVSTTNINRKATIVLEHLIQASDVAHTMQHWHIYRKWNQRLFEEVYGSYLDGYLDKDPSECWYQGELGFFDNYIIPLANKLETCGVFGVSSTEYKSYAEENRREWEEKGRALVDEYVAATIDKREQAAARADQEEDLLEEFEEEEEEEPSEEEDVWTTKERVTDCVWV